MLRNLRFTYSKVTSLTKRDQHLVSVVNTFKNITFLYLKGHKSNVQILNQQAFNSLIVVIHHNIVKCQKLNLDPILKLNLNSDETVNIWRESGQGLTMKVT